ncbi:MAG TPA: acetyl-CoA carboxylase biotin carboxyl carrier protein [Blastocatellia bacterium]|nr:acetyl-CoA carboxylase biotin carboxyl carrier protein [Blastocatellia bacterium]
MDLKEVKKLIELVSEKGFAEFEIEHDGFRLHISRFKEPAVIQAAPTPVILSAPMPVVTETVAPAAAQPSPPAPPPARPEPPKTESAQHLIRSPIVGTFYRAASPQAKPFVNVGDRVEADQVVCIIEAMKLMNEIQAEISGVIAEIYVQNGQPVEYGQPLFGITT